MLVEIATSHIYPNFYFGMVSSLVIGNEDFWPQNKSWTFIRSGVVMSDQHCRPRSYEGNYSEPGRKLIRNQPVKLLKDKDHNSSLSISMVSYNILAYNLATMFAEWMSPKSQKRAGYWILVPSRTCKKKKNLHFISYLKNKLSSWIEYWPSKWQAAVDVHTCKGWGIISVLKRERDLSQALRRMYKTVI